MITATATKKIKKPVTAKGLNIILSVTTGITILMLLFLILAAVFAGKEEGDATGGGEGDPKTVGTETVVFALLAILMLFAYFILLIVSFIKSLRFRKLGGGKAITSLCTVAFSFGILGIIIAMVGLVWATLAIFFMVITVATVVTPDDLANALKYCVIFIFIAIGLFGVGFLSTFAAMLTGWIGLRKHKIASVQPTAK